MIGTSRELRDLAQLLGAVRDGRATAADAQRIQRIIADDPAAMDYYADYMMLWASLSWRSVVSAPAPAPAPAKTIAQVRGVRSPMRWGAPLALAAAVALAVTVWVVSASIGDPSGAANGSAVAEPRPVATLLDARDVRWSAAHEPLLVGEDLEARTLAIDAGTLELELASGVHLVLDGPARFTIDSGMRCRLDRGRVWAVVPQWAGGFTVAGPRGLRVVDLGTRFEMNVEHGGGAQIRVIEGAVDVMIDGATPLHRRLTHAQGVSIPADRSGILALVEPELPPIATLPQVEGALTMITPRETLRSLRDDSHLLLVAERAGVTLKTPLKVVTGWSIDAKLGEQATGTATLEAGTAVDSYLVIFAPRARRQYAEAEATLTFDRTVLGLLNGGEINRTRTLLALPGVGVARGGIETGDGVTISDDRRSVHIKLSASGTGGDQVRLIVEAQSTTTESLTEGATEK